MAKPRTANVRIWTEKGRAVIRLVAKGIKMTATVKMELKTRPKSSLGTFFCTIEKKWILKMVRKHSKIRLPDEMMTAGKPNRASGVMRARPIPLKASERRRLV